MTASSAKRSDTGSPPAAPPAAQAGAPAAAPAGAGAPTSHPARARGPALLGALAAIWLTAASLAALAGAFDTVGTEPPIGIGMAAGLPPIAVLTALLTSTSLRTWAASLDLRLLVTLQAWRVGGFVFVAFWAQGMLPAGFALPAGLGDVAIAAAAPFVAYAGRRVFLVWTALGILDLVAAVTLGVLQRDPDMSIVSQLPLVLIPAFGVPFLLVVHLLSVPARLGRTGVPG